MGTSKILIDGVGIDLTQDTVAANKMLSGIKAHDSNGDSVIGNIQTWAGTQASGVKTITENGTYDVTQFASAVVNVPVLTFDVVQAANSTEAKIVLVPATACQQLANLRNNDSTIIYLIKTDNSGSSVYTVSRVSYAKKYSYGGVGIRRNYENGISYAGLSAADYKSAPTSITASSSGHIWIDEIGNLCTCAYDSVLFAAGTYKIIVNWRN